MVEDTVTNIDVAIFVLSVFFVCGLCNFCLRLVCIWTLRSPLKKFSIVRIICKLLSSDHCDNNHWGTPYIHDRSGCSNGIEATPNSSNSAQRVVIKTPDRAARLQFCLSTITLLTSMSQVTVTVFPRASCACKNTGCEFHTIQKFQMTQSKSS